MDDEVRTVSTKAVYLKVLRGYILDLLNEAYPGSEHSDVVYLKLKRRGIDTCINDVVSELHYLAEKQLVQLECVVPGRYIATITAAGRDVIEGTMRVAGVLCSHDSHKHKVLENS